MIAHKFLRADGTGAYTRFPWPLPDEGPGPWVEAVVDPCRSGIHACRPMDMPLWVGRVLYEVELTGDVVEHATKVVAPRARLLRRVEAWEDEVRDAYTHMCAERAHELAGGTSRALDDWTAAVEVFMPEGPGVLGFIAARIAEEISGVEAYHAERARQAGWLVERLGLR